MKKDKNSKKESIHPIRQYISVPYLENEAVFSESEIVHAGNGRHGGLSCHVCGNRNSRCPNCGGSGTPWLI